MNQSLNRGPLWSPNFSAPELELALVESSGSQSMTWGEVSARAAGLAALPAAASASTWLVQVPPSMHSLVLLLGLLRAGQRVVWLAADAGQPAWEQLSSSLRPEALVCAVEVFGLASKAAFIQGLEPVYTLGADGSGSLWSRVEAAGRLQPRQPSQMSGRLEIWAAAQMPPLVWTATESAGCAEWLQRQWSGLVSGPLWEALTAG